MGSWSEVDGIQAENRLVWFLTFLQMYGISH
jgi:hypothetical protein